MDKNSDLLLMHPVKVSALKISRVYKVNCSSMGESRKVHSNTVISYIYFVAKSPHEIKNLFRDGTSMFSLICQSTK